VSIKIAIVFTVIVIKSGLLLLYNLPYDYKQRKDKL